MYTATQIQFIFLTTGTLILDILMKNDLTDEELTDEIMTLMFAVSILVIVEDLCRVSQ